MPNNAGERTITTPIKRRPGNPTGRKSHTDPVTKTRLCSNCFVRWPLNCFHKKGRHLQTTCKACHNEVCSFYRYKTKPWLFEKYLNREKRYTVLLLYPGYMADDFGETFHTWVTAKSVKEAISKAQVECAGHCTPVAVYYGHRKDLYDGG